jgi:hypothetical protein
MLKPHLLELDDDGQGYVAGYKWYIRSSVINALWSEVMGRLAAMVWLSELDFGGDLKFPDPDAPRELVYCSKGHPEDECSEECGLWAHKIEGKALKRFWHALAAVGFPKDKDPEERFWNGDEFQRPEPSDPCLGPDQRHLLHVLKYFDPVEYNNNAKRMTVRVLYAEAYDFILYDGGLDLFVPPKPWRKEWDDSAPRSLEGLDEEQVKEEMRDWTRHEILRMYKFRKTGSPAIGLSGVPATSSTDESDYRVPMSAAPTGPTDVPHDWMRGMAAETNWWVTGSVYAAVNQTLPRLVASLWFEEEVRKPNEKDDHYPMSYRCRWQTGGGVKDLIQHRLETRRGCEIELGDPEDWEKTPDDNWNPRDVMITSSGLVIPHPGGRPELEKLLGDIAAGVAGNPVFTNTIPPPGPG